MEPGPDAETAPASEKPAAEVPAAATNGDKPAAEAQAATNGDKPAVDSKTKAIEELKAAIAAAAAKPKPKKPATEELFTLYCGCVERLAASGSDSGKQLLEILPKIGDENLVPLLGIRRPAPVVKKEGPAASSAAAQKVTGRVKSYNTRKGFGFITVPTFDRDIFVYNAHLIGRIGLVAGETVQFDLIIEGGRPQARNVKAMGGPPEPSLVASSAGQVQNPFAAIKQAMQEPVLQPEQPNLRDLALAMAAAAAEVPTTLPAGVKPVIPERTSEEELYHKISQAQSKAAEQKSEGMSKGSASASMPLSGYGKASETAGQKGKIRPGDKIKVTDFPALDVNGCVGVIRSYDSTSGRYSVDVEMRTGETVTMSLRQEYMQPADAKATTEKAKGSLDGAPAPPPLPGTAGSNALRKSAADALRKFQLADPSPAVPPQNMQNWQFPPGGPGGCGMGFPPGPRSSQEAARAAAGNFAAMQQRMQQGQPGLAPPGGPQPGGLGGLLRLPQDRQHAGMPFPDQGPRPPAGGPAPGAVPMPGRSANKVGPQGSGPGPNLGMPQSRPPLNFPQTQPFSDMGRQQESQQSQGMSLERSALQGGLMQQAQRPPVQSMQRPQQPQQTPQPPMPVPASVAALRPAAPPAPRPGTPMPPRPSSQAGKPEGSPGQVWVALHSPHFQDVIVRATQEVTSNELRRIMPGEVCTQRDMTMTLPNGLVRMPVEPDGWVTVHARNINGPTFLQETTTLSKPPPQPSRGQGSGLRQMDDMPLSSGLPQPEREKAPVDYVGVRASYNREDMLGIRQKLLAAPWMDKKAPKDMEGLRTLIVPKMASNRQGRPKKEEGERNRDKAAFDEEAPREGHRRDRDTTPMKEAPKQRAVTPKKDQDTGEAPTGEEKKQNCPTQ